MPRPRLKDPWEFWLGAAFVAIGLARLVAGGDTELSIVFLVLGLLNMVLGFVRGPREAAPRVEGPGPLAATPARRFRATGWPPSKDPDDYR